MQLALTTLTFTCRFLEGGTLPAFKGSALRGALGHALRETTCVLRSGCGPCVLEPPCAYGFFFDSKREQSRGQPLEWASMQPFALRPPLDFRRYVSAGEPLLFSLLLFGRAGEYLPQLIFAVTRMGELGLGAPREGKRARFDVQQIEQDGTVIFRQAEGFVRRHPPAVLTLAEVPVPAAGRIQVKLVTPLRFQHRGQFVRDLPFGILMRAVLRRITRLLSQFGEGAPTEHQVSALLEEAENVREVSSNLRWVDWQRYSNRQQTTMFLGGLKGTITYQGDLAGFLPYLQFAREVHIGKQTAFGLGWFDYELQDGARL